MKKRTILILLIPFLATLSCASLTDLYLEKPVDTNLEYWITERVSGQQLLDNGCTYLPGWFGAEEYLDSKYEPIQEEGRMATAPDIHVTYLITGYPDTLDDRAITRISITDPTITVYGLTMNSSSEDIVNRMKQVGGKKLDSGEATDDNEHYSYLIGNCTFIFSKVSIYISAPVTNKYNVVY